MDNEIKETAKAIQEVAKTTGQAVQTVDKIGSFFSKVMHESIDVTCGMLADTLKFKRWERQIKLIEKAEALIQKKGIGDRNVSMRMRHRFHRIRLVSFPSHPSWVC